MTNKAVTTRIAGPTSPGGWHEAIYTAVLETTKSTGILDVSGDLLLDFDYLYGLEIVGNDTIADNSFVAKAVLPAHDTAITDSNVSISFHYIPALDGNAASAQALAICNAVDLSSVGDMRIKAYGKQKAS
jgi:hypothetical protein